MGKLIDEFERKQRIYIANKRQYSKKSNLERAQKIRKFLLFCENLGVKKIRDINQSHYRQFVSEFLNTKSTETKRKYLYALREFFERAHLPIIVNPSSNINRTKEKKFSKLLKILNLTEDDITQEQKNKILELL